MALLKKLLLQCKLSKLLLSKLLRLLLLLIIKLGSLSKVVNGLLLLLLPVDESGRLESLRNWR